MYAMINYRVFYSICTSKGKTRDRSQLVRARNIAEAETQIRTAAKNLYAINQIVEAEILTRWDQVQAQ